MKYLPNYDSFSSKIVDKKNCQNPFPAIDEKREKVLIAVKLEGGGGKSLDDTAIKKKSPLGCIFSAKFSRIQKMHLKCEKKNYEKMC